MIYRRCIILIHLPVKITTIITRYCQLHTISSGRKKTLNGVEFITCTPPIPAINSLVKRLLTINQTFVMLIQANFKWLILSGTLSGEQQMNIFKRKPKQIVMTAYETMLYQQGHMWGMCGNNLTNLHVDYDSSSPFRLGWLDATHGISPNFDSGSVSTPALYKGVKNVAH